LPQQLQIGAAIRIAGENHLPGIAALRNMMGNVSDNHTGQASHLQKISEITQLVTGTASFWWEPDLDIPILDGKMGNVPSV